MKPAMTQNALTEEYLHALKKEEDKWNIHLSDGKCKTFDEYQKIVGTIKGIRISKLCLHDTIKMYLSAENIDV